MPHVSDGSLALRGGGERGGKGGTRAALALDEAWQWTGGGVVCTNPRAVGEALLLLLGVHQAFLRVGLSARARGLGMPQRKAAPFEIGVVSVCLCTRHAHASCHGGRVAGLIKSTPVRPSRGSWVPRARCQPPLPQHHHPSHSPTMAAHTPPIPPVSPDSGPTDSTLPKLPAGWIAQWDNAYVGLAPRLRPASWLTPPQVSQILLCATLPSPDPPAATDT